MYHLVEFRGVFTTDLEVSPKQRLERLRVRKGMKAYASLRPYVAETAEGPIEVADLYFHDGTVARRVPFERFYFVEESLQP
jgi:hypothetical protein